jgi:regulator of replication initiation timing
MMSDPIMQNLAANVLRLGYEVRDLATENANLKAEVERLRASSFVTAVPVEEYEKLKAEVENLRKSADISPPQSPQE